MGFSCHITIHLFQGLSQLIIDRFWKGFKWLAFEKIKWIHLQTFNVSTLHFLTFSLLLQVQNQTLFQERRKSYLHQTLEEKIKKGKVNDISNPIYIESWKFLISNFQFPKVGVSNSNHMMMIMWQPLSGRTQAYYPPVLNCMQIFCIQTM